MKSFSYYCSSIGRWNWRKFAKRVAVGVVGAAVVVAVVLGLVHLLGFGSGGIAAGSAAASFMSSYGGYVSSGSICAIAQSIGAAGLSAVGYICACLPGALAAISVGKYNKL